MNPLVPNAYTVTPAAKILSRFVTAGIMTEEEINADTLRKPEIFSSTLLDSELLYRIRQELDQANLDLELLKLDRDSADVTHNHYLSQRFTVIQEFTTHLQEVLREQRVLLERLIKPLCQENLPIHADHHRYVVEIMRMAFEFVQNLDMKLETLRKIPTIDHVVTNLNDDRTQLLALVTEVENLYKQVLKRRGYSQRHIKDMSGTKPTSQD